LEEDHITLMTMKHIKAICSKSNERKTFIQCVMDEYESNATIQTRHPKVFKDDTYKYHKWLARLMRHLKKAQLSNIKQIRFIRHIGRLDIYDNSREYEIEDDCYII
jgi:hypothetical protein